MSDYSQLYIYGLSRGYWLNIIEYRNRSDHDKRLVADMKYKEEKGIAFEENLQNALSSLEDFRC
jgi:hypothetical protein